MQILAFVWCIMNSKEAIIKANQFGAHNYKPNDVVIVAASGCIATDPEGKEYYDMLSAYSALNLGHLHPELIAAAKDQLHRVTLTSRAFHNDMLSRFLERLSGLTEKEMILPMNTGAEAVETAIKAARRWAVDVKGVQDGKQEIIACEHNFHGRTTTVISMSTDPSARRGFSPFTPGFIKIPYGDIDALSAAITKNTAAFIVEPIQGEAGIIVPPAGYLKRAYDVCKTHNVLFIADEIQTGLARTGRMFCCEWEGVAPDIFILGKALGGGIMPISAIAANQDVLSLFEPGSHGSTFGGNPLACAVSIKAMEILVRDDYPKLALERGKYFMNGLSSIHNTHIVQIRGKGLLIGIELDVPANPYIKKLIEHGILTKETHGCVIRLAPPLIIAYEQIDDALDRIKKAFAE